MTKFIKDIGLFALLLGTMVIVILGISQYDNRDRTYSDNNNVASLQIKSKFDDLDILFVGNSYCYSGIQPQLLDSVGLKSYNLGIATAGLKFYDLIIKDYLRSVSKKPKTIFILVSPMIFSSLADNFVSYPVHRYLENPLSNFEVLSNAGGKTSLFSACQRSFKKGVMNLILNRKGISHMQDTVYKYKGYVRSDEKVTPEIEAQGRKSLTRLQQDNFDYDKIVQLSRLTDQLEAMHIRVIYFQLPSNKLTQAFNREYLENYEAGLTTLSKKNIVLKIETSSFTPDDYRDIDHLNRKGSKKATEEIITLIKTYKDELGLRIKDGRGV